MNLLDDNTFSFNKPIVPSAVEEPVSTVQKKRYIRKETHIDNKTVKRVRIELTPSVCAVCALDIAEFNGLGNWYKVPEDRKADIIRAVEEHKKIAHPVKEDLIVEEDELPTSWLGKGTSL